MRITTIIEGQVCEFQSVQEYGQHCEQQQDDRLLRRVLVGAYVVLNIAAVGILAGLTAIGAGL